MGTQSGPEQLRTVRRLSIGDWALVALVALTLFIAADQYWTRYQNSRLLPSKQSVFVRVPEHAQKRFLDEVKSFASSRDFDVQRMAPVTPDGKQWSIWLERSDIAIFLGNPLSKEEFRAYLYERAGSEDGHKAAALAADLQRAMLAVPGITGASR